MTLIQLLIKLFVNDKLERMWKEAVLA